MSLNGKTGGSMEKLPDEVLIEIMQYLSMRDRLRSRSVCKKWNRILSDNSLWRHVNLTQYRLHLKALWKLVRYKLPPSLLTLRIRGCAYAGGSSRGKALVSKALLSELSTRCPNLRFLHLNECKMSSISFEHLPPSITCLEIEQSRWKPRWMKDKQMHLPSLEHLSLKLSGRVEYLDMKDITVFKNLKYLSLDLFIGVGKSGVKNIAKHLLKLEVLNLMVDSIDDSAVECIAMHLKKLKELRLVHCHSLTDRAVISIAEGLPVLNILNISYCTCITMRGLKSLFVSKLSVLIVGRPNSLSEKDKLILKTGFPENFVLKA